MVKPLEVEVDYRPDIDGLRTIAVLAVVFHHAQIPYVTGGFVGVDIFFVISGYLITNLIVKQSLARNFSFSTFYSRRVKRLFPAMFVTVAVTVAAAHFTMAYSDYEGVGKSAIYTILSIANFLFWLESGYFEPSAFSQPLLHMWSLSVEEQFYLLWPFSLLILLKQSYSRKILMVICLVVVVLSTASAEFFLTAHPNAVYYLLPFRAAELAVGAALVFFWSLPSGKPLVATGIGSVGLAAILWAIFYYTPETRFPGVNALVPTLGTAALIWSGRQSYLSAILRLKPVVFVGLISYSLYLVHWPLIAFYVYEKGMFLSLGEGLVLVGLAITLASVSYFVVEQPVRHGRLPGFSSSGAVNMGAALSAIILVTISSHIWANEGFPRRSAGEEEMMAIRQSAEASEIPPALRAEMQALNNSTAVRGRVLILGDSHAMPLAIPLFEWGVKQNVYVELATIIGGCPHLLGVHVFGNAEQSERCNSGVEGFLRRRAASDFDVVILSSRWGFYVSNVTSTDRAVRPPAFERRVRSISLAQEGSGNSGPEMSRAAFEVGLRSTVELFHENGAEVIFVGQVPPLGRDPRPCLDEQDSIFAVQINCASAPFEERMEEISLATQTAKELAERIEFHIFDPSGTLCDNEDCRIVDREGFYYSDGDHLSRRGSEIVGSRLISLLETLVPVPSFPETP